MSDFIFHGLPSEDPRVVALFARIKRRKDFEAKQEAHKERVAADQAAAKEEQKKP